MVEAGFLSYCRVDVLQEFFANSPDLAFGRVNKSANYVEFELSQVSSELCKNLYTSEVS